jgi:hypothetical protein
VGGQHVAEQVRVDAAMGQGGVGAAVPAAAARGQGHMRDTVHRNW